MQLSEIVFSLSARKTLPQPSRNLCDRFKRVMQIAKHEYLEQVKQNELRTIPVISDSVREMSRCAEEDRSATRGEPTMTEVSAKIEDISTNVNNISTEMKDTSALIHDLVNRVNLLEGNLLKVHQIARQSQIKILMVLHVINEDYVVLVKANDASTQNRDSTSNAADLVAPTSVLLCLPTGNLNKGVLEGKFADYVKAAVQISVAEPKLQKISHNDHHQTGAQVDGPDDLSLYLFRDEITEVHLKSLKDHSSFQSL